MTTVLQSNPTTEAATIATQNDAFRKSIMFCNDTEHPDMVLLHGGTPKGAEMIAARWADARGVTQVVFKPDWKNHGKAAPFKRNDKMLEILPQGLIATPGSGITENIVDKARALGIRVKRIGA